MKMYGELNMSEGSDIKNLTTPSGSAYPSNPNDGELYTHLTYGLSVYLNSAWVALGSGGGGTSETTNYNTVSRYQMITTTGQTVYCVSSATVLGGLTWSRTTTSLTLTKNSHGRSVGDRVIIRNTNENNQVTLITSVTSNNFVVTCADTGGTSGTSGAYSLGLTYVHVGTAPSMTGGTITAPIGGDVQLISLRIRLAASTRAGLTYSLIVPSGLLNGVGINTSMDNFYAPVQQVRSDAASMSAVGATIVTNIGSSYTTIQFGALGASTAGLLLLISF